MHIELGTELISFPFRCCVLDIESLQARTEWPRAFGEGSRRSAARTERAKVTIYFKGRAAVDA